MHLIAAAATALLLAATGAAQDNSTAEVQAVIAANRDNRTALRHITAPSWVASPEVRGTLSIVWSCLVTLIACVYTALHLNIPVNTGAWALLLDKAKWVAIALFAPEMVLYMASTQFFEARRFQKEMRILLRERGPREGDPDESTYSLRFSYFVVMGGFQMSIEDIYPSERAVAIGLAVPKRVALSTDGILHLAELGHFVTISEQEIRDKSKANLLQKILVVTQVGWMAVQCAVRTAWGLPISLLEIHTLVHVVCAIGLYAFWFKKPVDIVGPELVNTEVFQEVVALMVQEQFCGRQNQETVLYPPRPAENQSDGTAIFASRIPSRDDDSRGLVPLLDTNGQAVHVAWLDDAESGVTISTGQALACGWGYGGDGSPSLAGLYSRHARKDTCALSSGDINRAKRVVEILRLIDEGPVTKPGPYGSKSPDSSDMYMYRYPRLRYRMGFTPTSHVHFGNQRDWDKSLRADMFEFTVNFPMRSRVNFLLVVLLPAIYGGVHLAALRYQFPTPMESKLWETSCYIIMSTLLCTCGIVVFLVVSLPQVSRRWPSFKDGIPGSVFVTAILAFLGLTLLLYTASRIFIIMESFLSIRSLPVGVYWIPAWLQMFPHL